MSRENEEKKLKHFFDNSSLNVYESQVLNMAVGAPGTDLLENCCDIFKKATEHCLKYQKESNSSMLFQYGPPSGTYEARSAIAKYFTTMYRNEVKSEDIFITAGATQGLNIILATLVDMNGFVFVDEVTYFLGLDVIKQFSTLNLIPVKLNDDGVDLAELEKCLKKHQFKSNSKEFWGMYYTIPTFHNPTGIQFSDAVNRGLVKLARTYDILIACDDVYNILNYTDSLPPKRLYAYDDHSDVDFRGNVISNGSFSKILGPGLRLGWLEVPASAKVILEKSGIVNSGGCLNNYTSGILASLFELGLAEQHIKTMFNAYKERMLAVNAVLIRELPKSCSMIAPTGGYFIWIRLPVDRDAKDFLQFCMTEEKLFFISGEKFTIDNSASNCFRLSIAFHSKEKLVDGVKRLCSAMRKYLES